MLYLEKNDTSFTQLNKLKVCMESYLKNLNSMHFSIFLVIIKIS